MDFYPALFSGPVSVTGSMRSIGRGCRKPRKKGPAWSVFPAASVDHFDQEAHRTETVVAGDHGRAGIFHPAVI